MTQLKSFDLVGRAVLALLLFVMSTPGLVRAQAANAETSGEGPSTANGAWTLRSFPPVAFPKSKVPEAQAAADQAQQVMNQGRVNEALALLERAIQLDPVHPFAYWRLGSIQLRPGSLEAGLANLRKQLEVAPSAQAYLHTAFVLQNASYLTDAIQVWREGVKRYPADRDMASLFGEALARANLLDEAVVVLSAEADRRPQSSRLQLTLARALARLGKTGEVAAHVRRAVELEGGPGMLMMAASTLALAATDLDLALGYARQASADTEKVSLTFELPRDGRSSLTPVGELFIAWDTLSNVYGLRGQVEEAHAWGLAAYRLLPNARTAIRLGRLLQDRADFPGAARDYALGALFQTPEGVEARDRLSAVAGSAEEAAKLTEAAREGNRARNTFTFTRQAGPLWRSNVVIIVDRQGVALSTLFLNPPPPAGVEAGLKTVSFPGFVPAESSLPRIVVNVSMTCNENSATCSGGLVFAPIGPLFGMN